jgi:hypothetical protein
MDDFGLWALFLGVDYFAYRNKRKTMSHVEWLVYQQKIERTTWIAGACLVVALGVLAWIACQ